MAIFGPFVAPYGELEVAGDVWEPFSAAFPLGTDSLGRDILTRLLWGASRTIGVALAAALLSFAIGMALGFLAAVVGGWVDHALSRAIDTLMAIPTLIFALVILSVLPPSVIVLILVIAVLDFDPRVPAVAGGRDGRRGHGLRRGRAPARRAAGLGDHARGAARTRCRP